MSFALTLTRLLTVSPTMFLYPIDCYSLDGQTVRWVKKWLDDQAQKVEVNASCSN